jgi:regulator of protease activity HflC (stomatin/prohibitin superfamily)
MQGRLIGIGVALVVLLGLTFITFDIATIKGNQIGIKETWSDGVVEETMTAKTYFLFPGFTQRVYIYDLGARVFVMNDVPSDQEKIAEGRELDSYQVQSSEGQDMWVSLNVRWRIDPSKVIIIHKTMRDNIEEKLLRPVVMRTVKDECTTRRAIDAYSGEGLVNLQKAIESRLVAADGELATNGIIVDNFVIEKIRLHPE